MSNQIAKKAGSPLVVIVSIWSLGIFLILGPVFRFSSEYQLVANTFMSAVSYLMLFILQHTQNREGRVLQLKLDVILKALEADEHFSGCEDLSDIEIEDLIDIVRSQINR
jgi:low affinity Fe/Cu permease